LANLSPSHVEFFGNEVLDFNRALVSRSFTGRGGSLISGVGGHLLFLGNGERSSQYVFSLTQL
jgi:hypothetical protein